MRATPTTRRRRLWRRGRPVALTVALSGWLIGVPGGDAQIRSTPRLPALNPVRPIMPSFKSPVTTPQPLPRIEPYRPPATPPLRPTERSEPEVYAARPRFPSAPSQPSPAPEGTTSTIPHSAPQTTPPQQESKAPPAGGPGSLPPRRPLWLPFECASETDRSLDCVEAQAVRFRYDAELRLSQNRFREARALYERILSLQASEPTRLDAHRGVGIARLGLGEYREALQSFVAARYDTPFARGLVYWLAGDLDSAEAAMRNAITQDPDNPIYYQHLVTILREKDQSALVPALFDRAWRQRPEREWALERLFVAHADEGNWSDLSDLWNALPPARRANVHVKYNAAVAFSKLGRPNDALRLLNEVIRKQPSYLAAWQAMSEAAAAAGDPAGAGRYEEEYRRRFGTLEGDQP